MIKSATIDDLQMSSVNTMADNFLGVFSDRNRIYLVLIYFSLSFFYTTFLLSEDLSPVPLLGYMMALILVIVSTHDALLRFITEATGVATPATEINNFTNFLELNRRIHTLLEVDDVLRLVSHTLHDRIHINEAHFFVSQELPSVVGQEEGARLVGKSLHSWRAEKAFQFNLAALEEEIKHKPLIVTQDSATAAIKAIFAETHTNLLIPIVQEQQVLAVMLLGKADLERKYSPLELQAFSFLASQLTIILDRIRVYAKVMERTALDHAQKLRVMQSLSANIAHEMRTPLSGIRASISGIEEYLPQLLESHQWCMEHAKDKFPAIRESHMNVLNTTPKRIKLMIDQANTVIDMLLMNLRESALDQKQFNMIAAADIVEQAIDRYPFKSGQREKLTFDIKEDFKFLGIESLCIYLLFNLLKNAFYSMQSAQKGHISIVVRQEGANGVIYFRDTGMGIDPAVLPKVFEGFFTTKNEGTGVGLAYCKRTVESFGGSISCRSELGEFAEFVIRLPCAQPAA
jgi:signal transduction histidine kinase